MKEFECDLCVVGGAGHVGLPFAVVFAHKELEPKLLFLIQLYLRLRLVWRFFGQQSFILSKKPK